MGVDLKPSRVYVYTLRVEGREGGREKGRGEGCTKHTGGEINAILVIRYWHRAFVTRRVPYFAHALATGVGARSVTHTREWRRRTPALPWRMPFQREKPQTKSQARIPAAAAGGVGGELPSAPPAGLRRDERPSAAMAWGYWNTYFVKAANAETCECQPGE